MHLLASLLSPALHVLAAAPAPSAQWMGSEGYILIVAALILVPLAVRAVFDGLLSPWLDALSILSTVIGVLVFVCGAVKGGQTVVTSVGALDVSAELSSDQLTVHIPGYSNPVVFTDAHTVNHCDQIVSFKITRYYSAYGWETSSERTVEPVFATLREQLRATPSPQDSAAPTVPHPAFSRNQGPVHP